MDRSWMVHSMAGHLSFSQLTRFLSISGRAQAPFGWYKWGKMLLLTHLFSLLHYTHRLPYKPYPICTFLSRIDQFQCSEAAKFDPCRSGKAHSLWCYANILNKCMESRGIFFMLHLYSVHCATLVPD